MKLYEHEGKTVLAGYGVAVPRGALWPAMPDGLGPFVVKAQVLAGKRGRRGLIKTAADRTACGREAKALLAMRADDEPVSAVYVEERLDVERELYLAVLADRQRRAPLVLATVRGGMDVEEVPDEDLIRLPVDPLLGWRPFAGRYLASRLGCSGDLAAQLAGAAAGVYGAFAGAEAELVEVNPLVITRDGRLVAADAKVVLDDNAAFRHPERTVRPDAGAGFEQRCAALGVVGVEMEGSIAIIVSGAGLMMATVDLLAAGGGRLRAAIDLGGAVFDDPARLEQVVREVLRLRPSAVLVNAFFQLASCEVLARGVAGALRAESSQTPVVVRLRGRGMAEARALLEPHGLPLREDLEDACREVLARGRGA
jgi:succinyl-CoA synthetase beta subunit